MMDVENYAVVLQDLKSPSNKRDPRKLKLAAVASALSEVFGEDDVLSAAKVYAATVSALEGTLKESASSPESIVDCLSTQAALLEILQLTVRHMSNPAVLDGSLSVSSRVILGVLEAARGMETASNSLLLATKDDLGGIPAVLKAVCRASAPLIQRLSNRCDVKLLKRLYFGTLIGLLEDESRPKVRGAAQTGILEVLIHNESHPIIVKSTTSYFHNRLLGCIKTVKREDQQQEMLHVFGFLEKSMHLLDVSTLGADVMELLVLLLHQGSSNHTSDFVDMPNTLAAPRLLVINALLSTVIAVIATDNQKKAVDGLCPRVLATLLQSNPAAVFREGVADLDLIRRGRTKYADLSLACAKRLIETDATLACKLFPVVLQVTVQLCRKGENDIDEVVAHTVMAGLFATTLTHFPQLLLACGAARDKCVAGSLLALRQVLQFSFKPAWSSSLPALVNILSMVEDHDNVPEIVMALLKLRQEMEGDVASCRAIEEAVGSLIQSVGIEKFWNWVDWTSGSSAGINQARSWVVPVIKTASNVASEKRPRLEFFRAEVLDLARRCATMGSNAVSRSTYDAWVVSLWSLFPCFCHHPLDLEENLARLVPTLVKAIEDVRYPLLIGHVCFGLETLSKDAKERITLGEGTMSEENQREADVLSNAAVALLPVLFKSVERLHASSSYTGADTEHKMEVELGTPTQYKVASDSNLVRRVTEAIASMAGLAPGPLLQKLFKKVLSRLLVENQAEEVEDMKLYSLLALSQALVASGALPESSISLLYRTLKPMIRDDKHSKVQKIGYRVLLEICQCYHSYLAEAEPMRDLIDLLTETAVSANIPARAMRLKCIGALANGFGSRGLSDSYVVAKLAGEVLLCLKDNKGKTRNSGYQVLISLATATGDVVAFLRVVTSALASKTCHMRSAAVDASSRLVFEFARGDAKMQQALPALLQTVLILFNEQSREVIKSAVGFVRVCVTAMDPDHLRLLLPEVVGSLLKYHKGKDRFRKKIKIILKKLVRLYGYETLVPLIPDGESRLLVHMRKLDERAQRRKISNRGEGAPDTLEYDQLVNSDEYDSDEGKTLMSGATGLTRMTRQTGVSGMVSQKSGKTQITRQSKKPSSGISRLPNENDGEVLNILSLKERGASDNDDTDDDSVDEGAMQFDDTGRLVVFDEDDTKRIEPNLNDGVQSEGGVLANKRRRLGTDSSNKSTASSKSSKQTGGKGTQLLGASYKSWKAGGDVMKKGQRYEPYAYVPLDGRRYSKKNRRRAVEEMSTVVPAGGKRKRK